MADGLSTAGAAREAANPVSSALSVITTPLRLVECPRSAQRVLEALNRWFMPRPWPAKTTVHPVAVDSAFALPFSVGDSRIWRLRNDKLGYLTRDHSRMIGENRQVLTQVMGGDTGSTWITAAPTCK